MNFALTKLISLFYNQKSKSYWGISQSLTISILLLLVIAIVVTGFGLLVMSLEANSALGQWILPSSELKNAYKQGYPESNVTTIDDGKIEQQK